LAAGLVEEIVIATSNAGKVREIRHVCSRLPVRISSLADFPALVEPVEDGNSFQENARIKARYYARELNRCVLADDSGLEVDVLDGEPGIHSARFAGYDGADPDDRDQANNDKLLRLLADTLREERGGRFRCCLCLADPENILLEVDGSMEGLIHDVPLGSNGFGYDPLFWLEDLGCTVAQLSPDEKSKRSHRGRALQKLLELLPPLLSYKD
jgi:XTP/dITP diphosphohydrolase